MEVRNIPLDAGYLRNHKVEGEKTLDNNILVQIKNLKKYFNVQKGILKLNDNKIKAVDNVSFDIYRGETFSLVGESGCGKSTLGETIIRLTRATSGHVFFQGIDISTIPESEMKKMRQKIQIIFQDPSASLNPRKTIQKILMEPFIIHKIFTSKEREQKIKNLLDIVGIASYFLKRYPHELSGGQKQRVVIARALVFNPEFIVCDEPTSALDVSIQAQVINLLVDLQKEFSLTYLFVSHNLNVVYQISNRIAVMYLGKIVEIADSVELYSNPLHPYTKALLSAIPQINPKTHTQRLILEGDVPNPINLPSGCRFHTRCYKSFDKCKVFNPPMTKVNESHFVACHLYSNCEGCIHH